MLDGGCLPAWPKTAAPLVGDEWRLPGLQDRRWALEDTTKEVHAVGIYTSCPIAQGVAA
jgi:hypothetical protein